MAGSRNRPWQLDWTYAARPDGVKPGCSIVLLGKRAAPEGTQVCEFLIGVCYGAALFLQIAGDCACECRFPKPVKRIGRDRQVPARELVLALGAGFCPRQAVRYRKLDGLIVAKLEVKTGTCSSVPQ